MKWYSHKEKLPKPGQLVLFWYSRFPREDVVLTHFDPYFFAVDVLPDLEESGYMWYWTPCPRCNRKAKS
jgi:hypothetical protein